MITANILNGYMLCHLLILHYAVLICPFQITELSTKHRFKAPTRKYYDVILSSHIPQPNDALFAKESSTHNEDQIKVPRVVLVTGFESFNRDLYNLAASELPEKMYIDVFADMDIRSNGSSKVNPEFEAAMNEADAFIGSLIFDYDDVKAVEVLLPQVKGPRLIFECADELMTFNQVGSFNMKASDDGSRPGPPPAVKAVLSKFSSGREEDKLQGYLKMLKIGPDLLKYVPGEKASDLRTWLELYRYWNQGGKTNMVSMLQLLSRKCKTPEELEGMQHTWNPPELEVTPDIGIIHPLAKRNDSSNQRTIFQSPAEYMKWRLSEKCYETAKEEKFVLAPKSAPKVALLLFRKHVITEQKYIGDLVTQLEQQGLLPVPIFINGVEAHTIVRDLLTSDFQNNEVAAGRSSRPTSYLPSKAVKVDAIVNTIGFPLVGGPAGSMQAGRNIELAKELLQSINIPYFVAAPLLLQDIVSWRAQGVQGLQSVVLYALPELDGAIDTCVLGGLVGDKIALVPERVRKLASRIHGWVSLHRTPPKDRRIAISVYGFPPNVGAIGTAALLDVPQSLENILNRLADEGYDVGGFDKDPEANGESLIAALAVLSESAVITGGGDRMTTALEKRMERAVHGDPTVPSTLSKPGGGLGESYVKAMDIHRDDLEKALGKYMSKKVNRCWSEKDKGPGVSARNELVVSGMQIGNVWLTVQPLLGIEGDPMRLLFERDLTPHPQYCAAYEWMKKPVEEGGVGAQAVIHLGMHGTVEWLPGLALGNDRRSWSDSLLGSLPNIYVYAANNPSESILAKRRGYGTLVSYNVPPYGRAGLYLDLANLKDLVSEYKTDNSDGDSLREVIWAACERCDILKDVPLVINLEDGTSKEVCELEELLSISRSDFDRWILQLDNYLFELQERLFSSGLHTLGTAPKHDELKAYLSAYFGDRLPENVLDEALATIDVSKKGEKNILEKLIENFVSLFGGADSLEDTGDDTKLKDEAVEIAHLLRRNTEELDSIMTALSGGYVPAAPGGDLLRDGSSVLPTGRNIHALDPYRMPSQTAWARGQRAAEEILRQHREANNDAYPETVAVTLWGLDAIKTRGESVAIVLALVGATPVKEGTGRVVRFDLIPLEELGRPRVDVLCSLSGIFRDSFANIVDLLDDMFERAAVADEPIEMNLIKKHATELDDDGVERPAARLFSNPPGDYGSMVNEVVGSGDWEDKSSLGETWVGRNAFSYGKNELNYNGESNNSGGTARPEILDKLLSTTERVVQEIDSVEYGITDIQEYYANTGALKKAAENRKEMTTNGERKKVALSIVEAYGNSDSSKVPIRDVQDVLRIEYRSKLLNPKWRDAMVSQGSGGAYEISQRMTAMIGWSAATDEVDNFVFDQAAERYALDEEIADKLRKNNPEAFKNVIRRLLEANGRGMWDTSDEILDKLRDLYSEVDDVIEQVDISYSGQKARR